mmetsp:Transcript_19596/g.22502  ORF Transcript_19596/g.22502 Transcript_19596/m.22502 type:complete len:593 (-) Transcript_19596:131-1909(-)
MVEGEPHQPTSFASKKEMFAYVNSQLDAVMSTQPSQKPIVNMLAALGNLSALLFYAYNALANPHAELQSLPVNWVGFYLVTSPTSLALGPFQGRVACTKIHVGRGVCGTAVLQRKTLVVSDVHLFPGHIACDGDSNSEIVVPVLQKHQGSNPAAPPPSVVAVLDIDSTVMDFFSREEDAPFLEAVVQELSTRIAFPLADDITTKRPFGVADSAPTTSASTESAGSHAAKTSVVYAPTGVEGPTVASVLTGVTKPAQLLDGASSVVTPLVYASRDGWEFQFTEIPKMQSQDEQRLLETRLSVQSLPEMMFPGNGLRIISPGGDLVFEFDAFRVLQSGARIHQSTSQQRQLQSSLPDGDSTNIIPEVFGGHTDRLRVPSSPSWEASRRHFRVFDPKIDWAWRHRYYGFAEGEDAAPLLQHRHRIVEDSSALIDYETLKRQDLPIRMFGKCTLFEDDLHDNGMVLSSLKFRVMDSCFFILLRHITHVHGCGTGVRDVRLFGTFRDSKLVSTKPQTSSFGFEHAVVIEEQWRYCTSPPAMTQQPSAPIEGGGDALAAGIWNEHTADRLVEQIPVVDTKHFRIERTTTTTTTTTITL